MINFVCSKCRQMMRCTNTGRLVIFNKTMGGHGDEYSCPDCGSSIVFTNSKPFDVSGFLGSIREWADHQQIQGRDADFPVEVIRNGKSWGFSQEAIALNRDLAALDEKQLQNLLHESESDQTLVKMADRFTETEIIHLIEHPKFNTFTPEFKEIIWTSVSEIFKRELTRVSSE